MVQKYVQAIRERGGIIDTAVVMSAAKGIAISIDRTQLVKYGGPAKLQRAWARSLLKKMNFTKRKGTTNMKMTVKEFEQLKREFLQDVIDTVEMESIPAELIVNWDQTGLNLVPASQWTMAVKGSKRVAIKGVDDKRQITGIFCASLLGDFLPIQIIYSGKTNRCHPHFDFPADWLISHTENHWSNEATMVAYVESIIIPYVRNVRDRLGVDDNQAALAIFDRFKGQLTPQITALLEKHNIQSVLVPPGCTDRLQPLDVSVNKSAKSFLKKEFQTWYAEKITHQLQSCAVEDLEPVDLSTSQMKCVGAQWLVKLVDQLSQSPDIIVNEFIRSGISPSLSAGRPVMDSEGNSTIDEESEESVESEEEEFDEQSSNDDF